MHDLTPSLDPIQAPLPLIQSIGERGLIVGQGLNGLRPEPMRVKLCKILVDHSPYRSMLPFKCLVEQGIDSL